MITKRFCIAFVAAVCTIHFISLAVSFAADAAPSPVPIHWLDQSPPAVAQGVSWGVPWKQGEVAKNAAFMLKTSEGNSLPLQSWPLAYWPDGSIKWTGFATVGGPQTTGPLTLTRSTTAPATAPDQPQVRVNKTETTVEVDTGPLHCQITQWGRGIIDSMTVNGKEIARDGQLVCIVQDGPERDPSVAPAREKFLGRVEKVTVEQSGPVRAVIKLEGRHESLTSGRKWLPFVVRLYFTAGQSTVRMVHTIVYDGNEQKDFIRGLGVTFGVPMREELQNRHVRFSGEGSGLWAEPVAPLVGRPTPPSGKPVRSANDPSTGQNVYPDQIEGKRVPNKAEIDAAGQALMEDWPKWDGFKLTQLSQDGFNVVKRTNAESCWLAAGAGKRASGLVFVGDVSGGLGVSVKNFWQSFPAELEVEHATTGQADLTAWLWSPEGPEMDMRHYDTKAHGLEATYEDVQPGFSTPVGVARTSELTLFATSNVPSRQETAAQAKLGAEPAVLVCSPQYLHSAGVFGIWSLQDRSTPFKREIEDQLDASISYYQNAVDEWNWYGFWDFGDFMHSYDPVRHVWRYDIGGMAWDNSELGTDLWLWYSFLRSGRADIYRLAEAMTRHTSEVDCYHLGEFAGLGSRHNVRHWGCGAKEARISQAAYRRIFYYLSTDERTGDVMREMLNSDYKATEFDPMRLAQPRTPEEEKYPGRVRGGPDWLAFVGNWMTEWERTGDTKWRDKILTGMKSIEAMPYGFRSGKNLVFGYDPTTGKLYQVSNELGNYNLPTIMGGGEVMFELNSYLNDPEWNKVWLQYCRLGIAPADVLAKDRETGNEGADARYVSEGSANTYGIGRLAGYAYVKTKNPAFADKAIEQLSLNRPGTLSAKKIEGPQVLNPVEQGDNVSTNTTAQWSLSAIEVLEMCKDRLPEQAPPPATAPSVTAPSVTAPSSAAPARAAN